MGERWSDPAESTPMLLGLLIDVSDSMRSVIRTDGSGPIERLESVRQGLDDLVKRAGELAQDESDYETLSQLRVFAYGFGFGGTALPAPRANGS